MGVVALMVALIHLAPVGASVPPVVVAAPAAPVARGYVRVTVRPWGHIAIDGQERGTTPMARPLAVTAGRHRVTIDNDYYEPLEREIAVPAGDESSPMAVDIDLAADGTRVLRFAPDAVKR